MENPLKQRDNQRPEWMSTWSQFIGQSPFSQNATAQPDLELMQQLLEGATRGDSCLPASAEQVHALQDLVIHVAESTQAVAPFVYEEQRLYLYRYWLLEQRLAEQVSRLKQQQIQPVQLAADHQLLQDEYQKKALAMVAEKGLSIITGGPGTGKTYTLARIIAVLNQAIPNLRIAMAAPTGKAAQRMKEALQHSFSDEKLAALVTEDLKRLTPVTLHRLLGLGTTQQPRFHGKQPLPYDVIVVDEASMLDLNLAHMLFAAVPDQARLILLGDANQLASVDVGAVLADLQQVPALAEHRVNFVNSHRFKQGALIGEMARFIQHQHQAQDTTQLLHEFSQQVVVASELTAIPLSAQMEDHIQLEYLPQNTKQSLDWSMYYDKLMLGYQGYLDTLKNYLSADEPAQWVDTLVKVFDDYRILTAIRHGTFGLVQLNAQIEQRLLEDLALYLSKQGDWYVGRPVMMTYNDYQLGLSNGDIGLCLKHRSQLEQFEVYFPSLDKWVPAARLPKSIQTAFALTIHKSQGSEFTHTAVVLDPAAQNLLSQELIYTAITRAKKVVSLLVDREAFAQALRQRTSRQSGLVHKVKKNLCLCSDFRRNGNFCKLKLT